MDTDFAEEKLKSLQISSLSEEEDDDDEGGTRNEDVEEVVSDEASDEEDRIPMTLGFAEKPKNSWPLRRQYFPCKAGGSPAWLDPINLPSGRSSLCDFCCEPLQFLLQVYAPLPEESTFHRTLFVFICTSMTCLLRDQHEQWKQPPEIQFRSVKVFRCQLPRTNPFYSSEAPTGDENQQPSTAGAMLCDWCGTWKGDKICSSCKRARYCSGKHQAAHWRSSSSSHKVLCQQLETSGDKESESAASNSLWPEYEITNEDESEFDEPMSDDNGSVNSLVSRSRSEGSYGKLINYFQGSRESRSWASFQERISLAPDQVLRYSSSSQAKPIWPVSSGRPSKPDILMCGHCGSTRAFEFQVLPQLLYFFHVKDGEDSLDWATIAVYTCESSCEGGASYKEEFAWVQLASQSIS